MILPSSVIFLHEDTESDSLLLPTSTEQAFRNMIIIEFLTAYGTILNCED